MKNLKDIDHLIFEPAFFDRIWGGQKHRTELGLSSPADHSIGEAWLIADHPVHESVVKEGPFAGKTLRQLLDMDAPALLGKHAQLTHHGRFPLLLKILDAKQVLSVQVHPDDAHAKRLGEPDVGKTEMWHVLQADPGSELICGLEPNTTARQIRQAVEEGNLENLLTSFVAKAGDSVFVSAGTVHAIGGGNLLAEIQQNSDLTYRLYDFGRKGADGRQRELHIDKALEVTHYDAPPCGPSETISIKAGSSKRTFLAACSYFAAELVHVDGSYVRETRGESFSIVMPKTDGLHLQTQDGKVHLATWQAVFIPGATETWQLHGSGEALVYYVPQLHEDVVQPLLDEGHDPDQLARIGLGPDR
jgi:mannose-6-phosphate isomerase